MLIEYNYYILRQRWSDWIKKQGHQVAEMYLHKKGTDRWKVCGQKKRTL